MNEVRRQDHAWQSRALRRKEYIDKYRQYLASPEWKEIRRQIWGRCEGWCESCGDELKAGWAPHHLTYDRIFHEDLTDLIALCRGCHQAKHPDKIDHSRLAGWDYLEWQFKNL